MAEKGKRWFITDWSDTVGVIDSIFLNLESLVKSG